MYMLHLDNECLKTLNEKLKNNNIILSLLYIYQG